MAGREHRAGVGTAPRGRPGHHGPARTSGAIRNSDDSDDDASSVDASHRIGELPRDRRVILTLEWPHAGLPLTETVLTLQGVDDLDDRVLHLPRRDPAV